ncbi:hypothetical protein [Bacillus phage YungSlug]|nr:hypothetical protein [Bacillus phage YungSlug]
MNGNVIELAQKLLEKQNEESTCFGIAHDPEVKECKMCDLQQKCASLTLGNTVKIKDLKALRPETEELVKKIQEEEEEKQKGKVVDFDSDNLTARQLRKKRKKILKEKLGMPDTKKLSLSELWTLLKERGGECEVYDDEAVQKRRLSIAIRESFMKEYEEKYGHLE